MQKAILHLYGYWPDQPTQPKTDIMFDRRDKHQAMLASNDYGDVQLDYHVGYVTSAPSVGNIVPERVLIARHPIFDTKGELVDADFQPGDLTDYPLILDHYAAGFRRQRSNNLGIIEEFADGIGIDPARLINPWQVQNYGNDKRAAEKDILTPCGVALSSYDIHSDSIDRLENEWGEGEFIFKPDSGSLGQGIVTFHSLGDLRRAIVEKKIVNNGHVQPFIDLTAPIANLKVLDPLFDAQLHAVNSLSDRVREIRMHFFATTVGGVRYVKAYPMLRTSQPGTKVMENWIYTPLDPEAFKSYHGDLVASTIRTAERLLDVTGVPHAYGVSDISIGMSKHAKRMNESISFTGDFNVRSPRLPDVSLPGHDIITPAQEEFIRMQKTMASLVLAA